MCELDCAVDLYNQGVLKGQDGGQEAESKNQKHPYMDGSLYNIIIEGMETVALPQQLARPPYNLSTGPPSVHIT